MYYHNIPREMLVKELLHRYQNSIRKLEQDATLLNIDNLSSTGEVQNIIAALLLSEEQVVTKTWSLAKHPIVEREGAKITATHYVELEYNIVQTAQHPPMLLYVVSFLEDLGNKTYNCWAEQYFMRAAEARRCYDARCVSKNPRLGPDGFDEYFFDVDHKNHAQQFRTPTPQPAT